MKLEVPNTSFSPLAYFLAGALLPTIAYVFLSRNKESQKFEFEDEGGDDYDDDDYEDDVVDSVSSTGDAGSTGSALFDPIDKMNRVDPSQWGITDAPYKVSLVSCVCLSTSMHTVAYIYHTFCIYYIAFHILIYLDNQKSH